MGINEYIYADKHRLQAYVEQITGPVKHDKIPEWKAELSLTGPSAGASQTTESRSFTVHEMIKVVLEFLKKEHMLSNSREEFVHSYYDLHRLWERADRERPQFILETCDATRVRIPAKKYLGEHTRDIVIWLALKSAVASADVHMPGLLCLLEDFKGDDDAMYDGNMDSAYTILESLIFAIASEWKDCILSNHFKNTRSGDDEPIDHRVDAWHRTHEHILAFVENPIGTLESMGCRSGSRRRITTLYRVRDSGPEYGDMLHLSRDNTQARDRAWIMRSISVFGYPLFIKAE